MYPPNFQSLIYVLAPFDAPTSIYNVVGMHSGIFLSSLRRDGAQLTIGEKETNCRLETARKKDADIFYTLPAPPLPTS